MSPPEGLWSSHRGDNDESQTLNSVFFGVHLIIASSGGLNKRSQELFFPLSCTSLNFSFLAQTKLLWKMKIASPAA